MCDYEGRLVAWLDGELPADEASNVEWHVARCEECRRAVSAYEEISASFLDCYEASMITAPRRSRLVWVRFVGVAAAAAILLTAILLRPAGVQRLTLNPPPAPPAPAIAFEKTPVAVTTVHTRHRTAARHVAQSPAWRPVEPMVQIAIPADAMFPPGAVPTGFSYITEVSFGPDGSQAVRVWP